MNVEKQVCSICGASNPADARVCAICGARLETGRKRINGKVSRDAGFYDPASGEDDLLIVHAPGGRWMALLLVLIGCGIAALVLVGLNSLREDKVVEASSVPTISPSPSLGVTAAIGENTQPTFSQPMIAGPTLPPTNTRPPQLFPTITPTITLSPTPGPCVFTIKDGDSLYQLALQCGHRDFSAVQAIVEANRLTCDTCIKIGDVIEVPRPTPTVDPNASSSSEDENGTVALISAPASSSGDGESQEISADDILATRVVAAEPTLDPNLMYHVIEQNQTLYDVVAIYNIDVKLLSEINPEIEFPQCDFGVQYGGPNCAVMFYVGQRVRVPAPTRTPTLPPTATGSETPTPSATPTFNVPELYSPNEGTKFDRDRVVTLRWITSGTLGIDEAYVIRVKDLATGETRIALSCDQTFSLPMEWRGKGDDYFQFEWYVSVGRLGTGITTGQATFIIPTSTYNMCEFSFPVPVEWSANYGTISQVNIINERYPTSPSRFFWQGS